MRPFKDFTQIHTDKYLWKKWKKALKNMARGVNHVLSGYAGFKLCLLCLFYLQLEASKSYASIQHQPKNEAEDNFVEKIN